MVVIASEAKQSSGAAGAIDDLLDWQRRAWLASLRQQETRLAGPPPHGFTQRTRPAAGTLHRRRKAATGPHDRGALDSCCRSPRRHRERSEAAQSRRCRIRNAADRARGATGLLRFARNDGVVIPVHMPKYISGVPTVSCNGIGRRGRSELAMTDLSDGTACAISITIPGTPAIDCFLDSSRLPLPPFGQSKGPVVQAGASPYACAAPLPSCPRSTGSGHGAPRRVARYAACGNQSPRSPSRHTSAVAQCRPPPKG